MMNFYKCYLIFIGLFLTCKICLAFPDTVLATVSTNESECKKSAGSDFAICILNNTGHELNSSNFLLQEENVFEFDNGSYINEIKYGMLKNNSFLVIESTRKKILEGDTDNGISYSKSSYFFEFGKSIKECEFEWTPLTPPYPTPPTLIIENDNGKLSCHFSHVTLISSL